jgi:hypothetical protein
MDRTGFISDPIYKLAMGVRPFINENILHRRLKSLSPIIIYCRRDTLQMLDAISLEKKAHKSPEYLAQVKRNYYEVVAGYDRAMQRISEAGFIYQQFDWAKDNYDLLLKGIKQCVG